MAKGNKIALQNAQARRDLAKNPGLHPKERDHVGQVNAKGGWPATTTTTSTTSTTTTTTTS